MKSIALMLAALAQPASPATSPADEFCAGARLLAAGAAETPPFQTLRAQSPQFRMGRLSCFANSAGGYRCSHNLAMRNESRDSYATRVATCLPGATRTSEQRDGRDLVILRAGRLEALIEESGSAQHHVGRTIAMSFRAIP